MPNKFYVTTPIYYVNSVPHIGHSYTTIAADVLARYHRLRGDDTFFLTGADEHGAKIEAIANDKGIEPQKFVDDVAAKFQLAWDELDISLDRFIRTTETKHMAAVQKALQYMYDKGDIYLGEYKGLYCRGCEQYKGEKDLVDGLCPDHRVAPEEMKEECYMFRLSKYEKELRKKIEKDEFQILPRKRKNEILSFYKNEGLKDVSFSRKNVQWGIPLPWDKEHTTYVWADAFLNYLTGLDWNGDNKLTDQMKKFWPADVQLMSKDILRVHATIWPAMLMSLGLPLPKLLFIHGYWTVDGQKMSKSLGNVFDPVELAQKYGVDAVKFFVLSETAFGQDGDFSMEKFKDRYNGFLANGLGNVVARVLTLAEKYPLDKRTATKAGQAKVREAWKGYEAAMVAVQFDEAIGKIWELLAFCDGYIEENKPWELAKNNSEKLTEVLGNLLEILRHVGWMLYPVMPDTAEKILRALGVFETEKELKYEDRKKWNDSSDIKVTKPEILFPRI